MRRTPYTIREAREADIEVIADLGERFYHEAEWSDVAAWDRDSILLTLRNLAASDDGILIVADNGDEIVGMAGGLVHPLYFNHRHKTGQELFWWIKPECRGGVGGELFDALEQAAKDRGAQSWAMIALDRVRPGAVGAVYKRRGYRASEHSFIRSFA